MKKKIDYFLKKCQFNVVFSDYEYRPYITSKLSDNKTMCFWYKYSENVLIDVKNKGYNFNHIAGMNIITISNKLDMSNEFYIKHIMCALEWKLNAMIIKI